ncbi:hypothetical protein [Desulfonatronum thioautotrophicum]|uniref:hypothetical protein n=1 Tax=Desulfonatronum thioautotrophicum TaxID=617001 RepID=UPI00129468FC|nr:hypothetical protein [Desulfonatronum thioautotrophicum]
MSHDKLVIVQNPGIHPMVGQASSLPGVEFPEFLRKSDDHVQVVTIVSFRAF